MIFNTTNKNEDFLSQSKLLVGKAFSFFKKIKTGGTGSSRLVIEEFSPKLRPKNWIDSEINYANIELRPNGIIVHFTNRLERFAWVIPYYRLVTYNAQTFSIHAEGNFIKCTKNKNYSDNKKFIDRMIDLKNKSLNLEYYNG